MDLKEIEQFLDENTPAFLATLGTCGNPRVRPMQSPLLVGDRIYFCTSNNKGLFKHIIYKIIMVLNFVLVLERAFF